MIRNFDITDHVTLSPLSRDDAAALFALVEANREHLRQWLGFLDDSLVAGDTARFIEGTLTARRDSGALTCGIRVDETLVGVAGYTVEDPASGAAQLGYWVAEAWQGRGLVTHACAALIDHAFRDGGFTRMEIACAVGNRRSRAVAGRLRMQTVEVRREAEWLYDHFVDHVLYCVDRKDWVWQGRNGDRVDTGPIG